jgi:hypothetical protein
VYLGKNQIGVPGAQYLADVIKCNTVRHSFRASVMRSILSFNVDTDNARFRIKQTR